MQEKEGNEIGSPSLGPGIWNRDRGFIEYNIVWPSQKDLANKEQSVLTLLYFNDLKKSLMDLGELEQPVIDLLTNLGIDGVRVQYSAEDGDKVIKQAFPWR